MTCGACCPEAFQPTADARVFGYVVADCPTQISLMTGKLHYLGAGHVFADFRRGRVVDRKNFAILRNVMREGDRLILADRDCLGTKPHLANRHFSDLEGAGVEVQIIKPPPDY